MAVRRISLGRAVLELDTDLDPLLVGLGKGEKAVKSFGANTNLLGASMTSVFGGVTLANVAMKVVSFGADLLAAAGSLQDLHERTMVSVEGLQRLSIIAEQSGSSIDAVATAIFQMGKRLAGGDDSAAAALHELGLSFAEIRAMAPEDAFDVIGRALGALDDPMKRAELGARIFGRSVDELIPTFVNLSKETGAYITMSAGQVEAIDAIGDAFVRLKASIIPATVALIDNILNLDTWRKLSPNEMTVTTDGVDKWASAFARMTAATKANAQAVKDRAAQVITGSALDAKSREVIDELNEALARKKKRMEDAKKAADDLDKANKALHSAILRIENVLPGLDDNIGNVDDSVMKLGAQIRELTKDLSAVERHGWSTAGVMREFADDLEKLGEHVDPKTIHAWAQEWAFTGPILDDIHEKTKTWEEQLDTLANSLVQLAQVSGDSFGGILRDIAQIVVAMKMATQAAKDFQAAQKSGDKAGMAIAGVGMATAMLSATSHKGGNDNLGHMDKKSTAQNVAGGAMTGAAIGSVIPVLGTAAGAAIGAMVGLARSIHKVGEAEKEARKAAQEFASELANMATVAQQLEAGGEGWKLEVIQVRDAYLKAGLSVAEAEAAVTSLWDATREGAAATAAAQAVIQGVIDFNTDMVDSIHAMGAYTQEELQAVADHAKAVFEFMERTGKYTAEQLAVAWEDFERKQAIAMGEMPDAVEEVATAVDELAAKYQGLSDSVAKEAPEKVMGSIEKATRAEMATLEKEMDAKAKQLETDAEAAAAALKAALENLDVEPIHVDIVWDIPTVPGGRAPEAADVMAATTAGGRGGGTAVLELDRRVLAEVLVPELPGAIERHGIGRR